MVAPGVFPPIDLIPILKLVPKPFAPWIPATRAIFDLRDPLHRQLYANVRRRSQQRTEEEKREDGNVPCFMEVVMNEPKLDSDFASFVHSSYFNLYLRRLTSCQLQQSRFD